MIPIVKPYIADKKDMMPAIEEILYSGYIAEGQAVYKFEDEFRNYIGNKNTLAMNSGTAAIHIALTLLNIGIGDEVISTALTAEPTNTTIALTGAKIIWSDIDIDTGLIDPKSIRQKITDKTKAIIVVHYAGMVCDMDEINKISTEFNIPVIEDAAHALRSKYNNKYVGSNSDFTCFSFQAIKQLTTVDGGALSFNSEKYMDAARKLRWFGLDKHVSRLENDIKKAGFKYGMNNINATIGSIQLKKNAELIDKHTQNGKYFDKHLQNIPGIKTIKYYKNTQPSYWLYTLKVEHRDDFMKKLNEAGICATPLHHRNDTHSVFSTSKCPLPNLDIFYDEFIHLPCGWWVTSKEREYIIDVIKKGW